MTRHYLACDLGAESGRLMLGTLRDQRLTLEELHRFPNEPIRSGASIHWDIERLFEELKLGLRKAAERRLPISSISTDSWGVDYVLVDEAGRVMPPTFHYRDPRTALGTENIKSRVDWKTIFEETGIQFMPLNTLFQLGAETPERLAEAKQLLTIGDAFNFWLSEVARAEESNASTTQLYNPRTKEWSTKLIEAVGLPRHLFPPIVPSASRLGSLKADLAQEVGLSGLEVVASCTHDTGAAVAGIPARPEAWAYISSGTWSLMGVEVSNPVITEASRELNFTNEVGYGGSIRLLKNISGLWLVQECRRCWKQSGHDFDYAQLAALAAEAPAFRSLIQPMDARFLAPANMPAAISDYCVKTGQPEPKTPGAFVRCALESLALLYRQTLDELERLLGSKIQRVHIVGGGSRNALLNQFAANALQVPVETGPTEATALGNVVVQAIAMGDLPSLAAAREVIRASFPTEAIQPAAQAEWEEQFRRFAKLQALQATQADGLG
jgi:rhamnulokinase